jgi:hypothetical protein
MSHHRSARSSLVLFSSYAGAIVMAVAFIGLIIAGVLPRIPG